MSILFIGNVAPDPEHKWSLGTAWTLLALSLLLILASFLTSQHAILEMIRKIDEGADEIKPGQLAGWLNRAATVAFVLGVVFLVVFALHSL